MTVALLACGASASQGSVAAQPAAHNSLGQTSGERGLMDAPARNAPEWSTSGPSPSQHVRAPDRSEFAVIAAACEEAGHSRIVTRPVAACPDSPPERRQRCVEVCERAWEDGASPIVAPTRNAVATGRGAPSAIKAATSPASRPPEPDSFERALQDCVLRVRESGGAEAAKCRFDAPIDHMDFGQRHCDERCAAQTGGWLSR
jgi:hypothetical protein